MHNNDLGYYLYELKLKALPALPEKPIHFQTVLGSGQTIFAKFTNYTRQRTEYYCRVSSPCPTLCPSLARSLSSNIIGGGHSGCKNVRFREVLHLAWELPAGNTPCQVWVLPYRLPVLASWGRSGASFASQSRPSTQQRETVELNGHEDSRIQQTWI